MARPVDADALIHMHKSEQAILGKDWGVDDLAAAIETAPTIEAIPLEWFDWIYEDLRARKLYMCANDTAFTLRAWNETKEEWRKLRRGE